MGEEETDLQISNQRRKTVVQRGTREDPFFTKILLQLLFTVIFTQSDKFTYRVAREQNWKQQMEMRLIPCSWTRDQVGNMEFMGILWYENDSCFRLGLF